ncbi:hypothetical protein [Motilimonas sp. KMU-193]|uniref:hypothetical protein n=1 Tax=Motilimonas sp. KMU-193 TaxID=3388668 RepID=UPI00396B05F7
MILQGHGWISDGGITMVATYNSPQPLSFKVFMILVFLLCALLITSCGSEQQNYHYAEKTVWESLFLEEIKDAVTPYYLVNETEHQWFIDNPYSAAYWQNWVEDSPYLTHQLVKELYLQNQHPTNIDWQPIVTNGTFLPNKYLGAKIKLGKNLQWNTAIRDELCFETVVTNANETSSKSALYRPFYSVSRVAFSQSGETALVKYSYYCAPMSGEGEFFALFNLEGQKWRMAWFQVLWIS